MIDFGIFGKRGCEDDIDDIDIDDIDDMIDAEFRGCKSATNTVQSTLQGRLWKGASRCEATERREK